MSIVSRRTVTLKGEALTLADLRKLSHHAAIVLGLPDDSKVETGPRIITITDSLEAPEGDGTPEALAERLAADGPRTLADVVRITAAATGVDVDSLKAGVAEALEVDYWEDTDPPEGGGTPRAAETKCPSCSGPFRPRHGCFHPFHNDPPEGKKDSCPWCGSTAPGKPCVVNSDTDEEDQRYCLHSFHTPRAAETKCPSCGKTFRGPVLRDGCPDAFHEFRNPRP